METVDVYEQQQRKRQGLRAVCQFAQSEDARRLEEEAEMNFREFQNKLTYNAYYIMQALQDCLDYQNSWDSEYKKEQEKVNTFNRLVELLGMKPTEVEE